MSSSTTLLPFQPLAMSPAQRTCGSLVLRPVSGKPIDRRDAYRMVSRNAKAAGIPRHISPNCR